MKTTNQIIKNFSVQNRVGNRKIQVSVLPLTNHLDRRNINIDPLQTPQYRLCNCLVIRKAEYVPMQPFKLLNLQVQSQIL